MGVLLKHVKGAGIGTCMGEWVVKLGRHYYGGSVKEYV